MLICAQSALGDSVGWVAAAEAMAAGFQRQVDTGMRNAWQPNVLLGCTLSVLGRDVEALEALERMGNGLGLPQMPLLLDLPCFQRFQEEPRYRAVVANIARRQAELQERLSGTLRAHGVEPAPVDARD
jgi:hypothetical protein